MAGAAWEKQQVVGKRGKRERKETIRDVLKIKSSAPFPAPAEKTGMVSRERQGCAAPASPKSLPVNAAGMIFPGSRGFGKGVTASHLAGGCGFSLVAVSGWVEIVGS